MQPPREAHTQLQRCGTVTRRRASQDRSPDQTLLTISPVLELKCLQGHT